MIPYASTDLAAFFDTDDFAETITVGGASVLAIFDAGFAPVNFANGETVEGGTPKVTCKSADVAAAAHGTAVVVRSVTYYVVGIQADGAGLTVLILSANAEG
jgi:hypothetical protein